jgi:hypothetical protein
MFNTNSQEGLKENNNNNKIPSVHYWNFKEILNLRPFPYRGKFKPYKDNRSHWDISITSLISERSNVVINYYKILKYSNWRDQILFVK